ncbi:22342_t:CDS:1, partial [Rhizophagus irregularis]
ILQAIKLQQKTLRLRQALHIVQVYKISKTDTRLGSLAKDIAGWFNTYQYKFHK